jgi:hypothetical protein
VSRYGLSGKLWATIVAITSAVAGPSAGVGEAWVTKVVLTGAAYILGTGLDDGVRQT